MNLKLFARRCFTGVQLTKVSVKVANIAFHKNAVLHYQQQDGSWTEQELMWQAHFDD
ncbi:MAG: hypothetical protein ACR65R_03090 [Methylomicrobium sp.]